MNPFNRLWLVMVWLFVAIGLGGRYLAHDMNIAVAALVIVAFMTTVTVAGADRADRKATDDSR